MKQIKIILCLIFFISIQSFCQSEDQSTVYGKIINFNELTDPISIKIETYNYFSQRPFSATDFINGDGEFKLEFKMLCTHNVYLSYGDHLFQIICSPGKSLHLEISREDEESNNQLIRFENSKINDDLHKWNTALVQFYERVIKPLDEKSELSEIQSYHLENKNKILKFWTSYQQEVEVSDTIIQWVEQTMNYETLGDLMIANSLYSQRKKISIDSLVSEGYYDFLDSIQVNNESALLSSGYIYFLNSYGIFANAKIRHEIIQYGRKKDFDNLVRLRLDNLVNTTKGFSRDVILSRIIDLHLRKGPTRSTMEKYFDSYINKIENKEIKRYLVQKYQKGLDPKVLREDFVSSIEILPISDSTYQFISNLINQHKGKVVYIDFWATWCGPCLAELKSSYEEFIKQFEKDEVVFIFLAAKSSKSKWMKKILDFDYTNNHYLLSDNQYSVFESIFKITGFPHHALIDKRGKIVSENTSGVGVTLEEEIRKLIRE